MTWESGNWKPNIIVIIINIQTCLSRSVKLRDRGRQEKEKELRYLNAKKKIREILYFCWTIQGALAVCRKQSK